MEGVLQWQFTLTWVLLVVTLLILLSSMIIIVVIKLANICILSEYPRLTAFKGRYGTILSLISAGCVERRA